MENQHVEEVPTRPVLPLLALLALASALGVAVAVALAALAMLLASPAYADDGGEGGLLLERGSRLVWAQRVSVESESSADAHIRVIEVYQNPYPEALSGVYLHRLPRNAVLERLAFAVGEAEALPALLTLRRGTALVERTAEIGPGESLLVELEYRTPSPRSLLVRCCR